MKVTNETKLKAGMKVKVGKAFDYTVIRKAGTDDLGLLTEHGVVASPNMGHFYTLEELKSFLIKHGTEIIEEKKRLFRILM